MYFCADRRLCFLVVALVCVVVKVCEGKPQTPSKFYASISSTAELPCVSSIPGKNVRWVPRDRSSRTRSVKDGNDPDLLYNVISNVQLSDAGRYTCTDGMERSVVDLVVVEPSQALDVEARIVSPDEIKVKWKAPLNNPEELAGYHIYVTEVAETGKEVRFVLDTVRSDGMEEFPLTDFSPGSEYEIQVAPMYLKGNDDIGESTEGPRSPKISINTPVVEHPRWMVKAEPFANNSILVTWVTPKEEMARGVGGYIVYYQVVGKKNTLPGELPVKPQPGNRGSAVLKGLPTRQKYKIRVAALRNGPRKVAGSSSEEVVIAHDGFNPELSIRAVPLGPDTVLVSLDTVGGDKVEKLRIFYSDESAIKWEKVDGYKYKEKYVVVTGLQPKTRYFFMAKAAVNKKARSVVTHVLTPPTDLTSPTNVAVTAKSDSSVLVTWDYRGRTPANGFVVQVDQSQGPDTFSPDKHHVVFKENEALVDGLASDQKYQVKVEPFDVEGLGTCSDPILFQLSAHPESTTRGLEQTPPRFVNDPPEELNIDAGEDIKLMCAAIGVPPPTVRWFLDNRLVGSPAEQVNDLSLAGVQNDVELKCVASNTLGTVEHLTRVSVTHQDQWPKSPKFITDLPEELYAEYKQSVDLSCPATGEPTPIFRWFVDNRPVAQQDHPNFRINEVERDVVVKCMAYNDVGSIFHETRIRVLNTQPKPVQPGFEAPLPEYLIVPKGSEMRQVCSATGYPVPTVTWYKDGNEVRSRNNTPGSSTFTERRVYKHFDLKCVISNENGWAESVIKVYVQENLRKPTIRNQLPSKVVKKEGEELNLTCIFAGNPLPEVTWYNGSTSLSGPGLGSSNLILPSVKTSMTLTCRGRNLMGTTDEVVEVNVMELPDAHEYKVNVTKVNVSPSEVKVKWAVNEGDLSKISHFAFKLRSTTGAVVMSRDRLSPDLRSINLRPLLPNTRYGAVVVTLGNFNTMLDTSTLNFTMDEPAIPDGNTEPVLYLEIVEIRDVTARIDFTCRNVDPQDLHSYRLMVKDLGISGPGSTIITRPGIRPDASSIFLERLKPYSAYQVIIDAVHRRSSSILTASANFSTPRNGEYGLPVYASSPPSTLPPPSTKNYQAETTTVMSTTMSTRRTRPMVSRTPATTTSQTLETTTNDLTTTSQTLETTTNDVTTPTTAGETTTETEEDHTYVMVARAPNTTPNKMDVRWTLQRGPLENIKDFTVTLKGEKGQILLQQNLPKNQRYITIQPLNPGTKYFVNIKANGQTDVLVESDLVVDTALADDVPDTTNPVLELEANEVRDMTTRLDWIVVRAEPDYVANYRLQVLDGGPDGPILLTQASPADSLSLTLQQLTPNTKYHAIVEALGADGGVLLTSALTFQTASPNRYGTPVNSSSDSSPPAPLYRLGRPAALREPEMADEPVLEVKVDPITAASVSLSWSTRNLAPGSLLEYLLKVRSNGPDGYILLEYTLPPFSNHFRIDGLHSDRTYYLELAAISDSHVPLVSATTLYTHDSTATPLEFTSTHAAGGSTYTDLPSTTSAVNRDRRPNDGELVITKAAPEGPGAIFLELSDSTSTTGETSGATTVRFAEMKNNLRGDYNYRDLPSGQRTVTIKNLKSNTPYGLQVALKATDGRNTKWSSLRLVRTV